MVNQNLKTVAIIGRPNVGKSTLFNRLVGKRIAIETPIAGTTRDRLYGEVLWRGQKFNLIDAAGIDPKSNDDISISTQKGVELAIENSDLILFMVDWNDKDNQADKNITCRLRRISDKVLLVVNKADNIIRQKDIKEFERLGNFKIMPISAISGKSSGDLLDIVVSRLKKIPVAAPSVRTGKIDIRLAIIGRPNVGKSTLLNMIIGAKRAIVSDVPGTTRDTISVEFMHKGKKLLISDTAGIRRPGKILKDTIESFSVLRSYHALKDCDVAILIIDAHEGLVALDTNILGKAKEWGKGIVLAINKIDLISENRESYMARVLNLLQNQLNFAPWLPAVFISAQNNENINFLLNQVVQASKNRQTIIKDKDLEQILQFAKKANPQLNNVISLSQDRAKPPIFKVKIKGKIIPHYTQIRYLENRIRDAVPMAGSPIFIDLLK